MDSGKLLWATGVSYLRQEKRKKFSDNAATDGDPAASFLRGDVAWPDKVEDDGQRVTAVGNRRQSPKAITAEKIQ